jgi:ATPase subunit of ABC transporter with duplicated ATPase domains
MLVILISLLLAGTGCKSKKKAMEAQAAAEKARLEQEAALQREKEREAELQRQREAEEAARRNAEARTPAPAQRLGMFFEAVANAGNVNAANTTINEALAMFASPDTPVLIVISEENGQKDYDRPTTIRNYLNYLKDTRKNMNRVGNVQVDGSGKITELELIKQE